MLLAATNSGTLIIALPSLERSLHASLLALVWVILAYLIAATVLVLTAGRLSDLFGRKRAYVGGFLLFAFASLGAGFSGGATELICWRVLQGIGSAFLFANAAALVTDAFPKEQLGLAMGANTMVAAVGLVLGSGSRRRARRDLLALGLLVQRAARAGRRGVGCADPARAGQARQGARLRHPWHRHVRSGAYRPRAWCLQGRLDRMVRSGRDRRSGVRCRAAAAVGPDRATHACADARPVDLQQPPVRGGQRRLVHQRAGPLRADVPVRLLLPGRPIQQPDRSWHQADTARPGHARCLPPGRHLRRPPRLAHVGLARHARQRRRPCRHDDLAGTQPLLAVDDLARRWSASARACSTAPTPLR